MRMSYSKSSILLLVRDMPGVCLGVYTFQKRGAVGNQSFSSPQQSVRISMQSQQLYLYSSTEQCLFYRHVYLCRIVKSPFDHHPTIERFTQAHDDKSRMSDKWLNQNPFLRLQKTYKSRRV